MQGSCSPFRDGHIHTPYCPHGIEEVYRQYKERAEKENSGTESGDFSIDEFRRYVDVALERGLREISFTEHMPLPCYFLDDREYLDECAPPAELMDSYFADLAALKAEYRDRIVIRTGLEVDYLDGYEAQTARLLDRFGPLLEDSLLSVHFVKIGDTLTDIDVTEGFERACEELGSVEKVYDRYYETVLKSIECSLGSFKPKRIGHPDLVRIFNRLYPVEYTNYGLLDRIAAALKAGDYEVDLNTSGLRKPFCGEMHLCGYLAEAVDRLGIRKVYGSDAHRPEDVGLGLPEQKVIAG